VEKRQVTQDIGDGGGAENVMPGIAKSIKMLMVIVRSVGQS